MDNRDIASMFYGATPAIFELARELRKKQTAGEKELWKHLSYRKLSVKFRRQHPIAHFIADFYCHELRLIIEVDGEIHKTLENRIRDQDRDEFMAELGLSVLRFTNEQVLKSTKDVIDSITKKIVKLKPI